MTNKTKPVARKKGLANAKLDELIEEATVDAYDESEQTTGFYTTFEEHLALPLKTEVLCVEVTVERIDVTNDERIGAVCARGKSRQRITILDLRMGLAIGVPIAG
jgi:hypothetical protein